MTIRLAPLRLMNTTSLDQNLVQGSDDDGEDETEDETRDDNCSFIVSLGYNTNIFTATLLQNMKLNTGCVYTTVTDLSPCKILKSLKIAAAVSTV